MQLTPKKNGGGGDNKIPKTEFRTLIIQIHHKEAFTFLPEGFNCSNFIMLNIFLTQITAMNLAMDPGSISSQ